MSIRVTVSINGEVDSHEYQEGNWWFIDPKTGHLDVHMHVKGMEDGIKVDDDAFVVASYRDGVWLHVQDMGRIEEVPEVYYKRVEAEDVS